MNSHFLAASLLLVMLCLCEASPREDTSNLQGYSRNFVNNLWPKGEVPYTLDERFSTNETNIIEATMKRISNKTCVRYVSKTNQTDFVRIKKDADCYVGLGYGDYYIYFDFGGCNFNGPSLIQVLLRSLGFDFEHKRPDRDDFVEINWDNVNNPHYFLKNRGENDTTPECEFYKPSFSNCNSGYTSKSFGYEYDHESVMHGPLNFFSKNGNDTIILKNNKTANDLGNGKELSDMDITKINAAYQCQPPAPTCKDTWRWCSCLSHLCGKRRFINRRCKKTCFNCECKNQLSDESCIMIATKYCRFGFVRRLCSKECGEC